MRIRSFIIALASLTLLSVFLTAALAEEKTKAQEGIPYPDDIIYEGSGEAVVFSHKAHVSDFGLECDGCHTSIFGLKAFSASKSGDFTMKSLYDGKYCGACHNGTTAFASDDFEQCGRCHVGAEGKEKATITGKPVKGPQTALSFGKGDDVAEFRHTAHEFLSCGDCHTAIFPMKKTQKLATMDEINAGKACGMCHNGQTAFDQSNCGKCHPKM